ncbi:MAG: pitrilysin family protein, partial [Cyclobacteriaceae bacterium]
DTVIRQKIHSLSISDQKDNEVAAKRFRQNLFGLHHPYGKILKAEDLQKIKREDLLDFYEKNLFTEPVIVVCGKVDEEVLDQLGTTFGQLNVSHNEQEEGKIIPLEQHRVLERPESVQSAIRMGHLSINKHHPDIHKLHITTSLLGGYFGSRLMDNIREDKGYTYGISANIAHLHDASFFIISTNVVKQYTSNTVDEILKEINLLQTELVPQKELDTVKNYLRGKFLSGLDTAFNIAGKFNAVMLHGLDYEYYNKFLAELDSITPEVIMDIARKYYDTDNMRSVIVGEKQ